MMSLITIATCLAAFFGSFTLGKVGNVYVPSTAKAGTDIQVKIQFIGSPITYDDFAAIFGIHSASQTTCANCLGSRIGYVTLLNNPSVPPVGNASFTVQIPNYLDAGNYVFGTGIPRLVGINGGTDVQFYFSNMKITAA